jgi:MFS superfamily sulfate permease-like transporter
MRFFAGLRPITARGALRETLAGVNLAAINIPQVLGYARIAGMPVVTGLYTVLLPLLAFAAFGSSRHLVVAADSATAAILAGSVSHMATPGGAAYVGLVGTVALLTAAWLLVARLFKLGFLADFLSRTVLTGFLTGVGIQVAIGMLGDLCGIATMSRNSLVRLWEIGQGLAHPNLPTLSLAAFVIAMIMVGNRLLPRLPLALLAVAGSIVASALWGLEARGIAVIGAIPGGLPALQLPVVSWNETLALVPISLSCVVMIIAQSAATSRAFAVQYHEQVDANADLLGLAAANSAAAITGAFVVNGSPTQTAMADHVGARSQLAQIALAAVVLLVLLFLTGPLQYLPAAIVFTIAVGMIDVRRLRDIRRESPGEFSLAIVTATVVVAVGVEQGILLAIALSLFRHVSHSYRPHTMMFVTGENGQWLSVPTKAGQVTEPGLIVYRFGADLFYANENGFVEEVRSLVRSAPMPIRWFIVDSAAITDLDFSAAKAILDLIDELAHEGVTIVFGRVNYYLRADMDRHGIGAVLGDARICTTLHAAIALVRGESTGGAASGGDEIAGSAA